MRTISPPHSHVRKLRKASIMCSCVFEGDERTCARCSRRPTASSRHRTLQPRTIACKTCYKTKVREGHNAPSGDGEDASRHNRHPVIAVIEPVEPQTPIDHHFNTHFISGINRPRVCIHSINIGATSRYHQTLTKSSSLNLRALTCIQYGNQRHDDAPVVLVCVTKKRRQPFSLGLDVRVQEYDQVA
jgi:hypothetical protein